MIRSKGYLGILNLGLLLVACQTSCAQATAFSYQGRLNDGANPANGNYDLRFAIYDAENAGSPQGNWVTNAATSVSNGLFTVALDFGNQFPGANRWLEIAVRTNGALSFFTLTPRQPLTPAPYAITAGNVVSGGLAAGTYGNALTLNNAANQISGSFAGNGASLSSVNASTLSGIASTGFWKTTGNAGTSPGANFIGTTDSAKLLLRGSFVGVNRSSQVSPQEYFGFDAPAAPGDFGGMYINTTNGTSLPFYGYALNGGVYAYHYVDGVDGFKWKLAFGGIPVPPITAVPGNPYSSIGLGTTVPQGALHIYSANNPTVVRIQSSGTPGLGRMEFVSNPQGDVNEWRPGYIQSTDNGGFTGGLAFYVNGTGSGSKFGSNEVMRIVNGAVGINKTSPASALDASSGATGNGVQGTCNNPGSSGVYGENLTGGGYGLAGRATGTGIAVYGDNSNASGWAAYFNGNVRITGTLNPSSDRNVKRDFQSVHPSEVLEKVAALNIQTWVYTNDPGGSRHLGPVAQDFRAAFGLGRDDKTIATVDADGVALAAIQGLNQKLTEKEAEIQRLKSRSSILEERIGRLEQLLIKN